MSIGHAWYGAVYIRVLLIFRDIWTPSILSVSNPRNLPSLSLIFSNPTPWLQVIDNEGMSYIRKFNINIRYTYPRKQLEWNRHQINIFFILYSVYSGWAYSSIVRAKTPTCFFFLLPRRCGGPCEGKDERVNELHAGAGRPEPIVFHETNYQLSFPFHFSHPPHHIESNASLPVIRLKLPAPCVAARSRSSSPHLRPRLHHLSQILYY